jgi:hypothetical protein
VERRRCLGLPVAAAAVGALLMVGLVAGGVIYALLAGRSAPAPESPAPGPEAAAEATAAPESPLAVHVFVSAALSDADLLVLSEVSAARVRFSELSVLPDITVVGDADDPATTLSVADDAPFPVTVERVSAPEGAVGLPRGLPKVVIADPSGHERKVYESASEGLIDRVAADLERYLADELEREKAPETPAGPANGSA